MNSFQLKLEAFGGADISDCAREACRLAGRLGVVVMFDFNGVSCMACPGDDPTALANAFHKELAKPELLIGKSRVSRIARGCRPEPPQTQVSGVG